MKRNLAITLLLGAALGLSVPTFAQSRGGGGHSGGGSRSSSSGVSHSSSSSRSSSSGVSHSSPSSSRSSSSYSGSSSRSSSHSSSSRSTGSYSSSASGVSHGGNSTYNTGVSRSSDFGSGRSGNERGASGNGPSRGSSVTSSSRHIDRAAAPSRTPNRAATTPGGRVTGTGNRNMGGTPAGNRPSTGGPGVGHNGTPAPRGPEGGYATPGHPGGYMPHADRPMHPAPFFHHPHHHHHVHMHLCYWDPCYFEPLCYHGFWGYCNSYWYDYHPTNVIVVREYMNNNYRVDMVGYVVSGDLLYMLVRAGSDNLLQVFDRNDNLIAQQRVSRKYISMEIDRENGGCWLFKKNDRDPLLFMYADGQLLIYEAD